MKCIGKLCMIDTCSNEICRMYIRLCTIQNEFGVNIKMKLIQFYQYITDNPYLYDIEKEWFFKDIIDIVKYKHYNEEYEEEWNTFKVNLLCTIYNSTLHDCIVPYIHIDELQLYQQMRSDILPCHLKYHILELYYNTYKHFIPNLIGNRNILPFIIKGKLPIQVKYDILERLINSQGSIAWNIEFISFVAPYLHLIRNDTKYHCDKCTKYHCDKCTKYHCDKCTKYHCDKCTNNVYSNEDQLHSMYPDVYNFLLMKVRDKNVALIILGLALYRNIHISDNALRHLVKICRNNKLMLKLLHSLSSYITYNVFDNTNDNLLLKVASLRKMKMDREQLAKYLLKVTTTTYHTYIKNKDYIILEQMIMKEDVDINKIYNDAISSEYSDSYYILKLLIDNNKYPMRGSNHNHVYYECTRGIMKQLGNLY